MEYIYDIMIIIDQIIIFNTRDRPTNIIFNWDLVLLSSVDSTHHSSDAYDT